MSQSDKTHTLEDLQAELERSNRDLEDFTYIVSHDLKEPLRGISTYSTFLIQDFSDKLDDEGRGRLESLQRLCSRMEGMIDALLHYSRVGRAELAIQETDLNELVREILDSMHVTLKEANVEVRTPRPLPAIKCDTVQVRELLQHLITNAATYNDHAEKWVEIGSLAPNDDDLPITFFVRDNGIGIREKHFEGIFRIFKRLHGRDKYGGGTGAGLTFAKKIAERHGGRIWVESEYGVDSTFFFTLHR